MRKKPHGRARLWVLSHCEVFHLPAYWYVDELPLAVASSRRAVARLIRASHVEPETWWRVQAFTLDAVDGAQWPPLFYSRSGRLLSTAPTRQALRAWPRIRRRRLLWARRSLADALCSKDRRAIRLARESLRLQLKVPARRS